jgi:predicted O-methyltransferase YrrM
VSTTVTPPDAVPPPAGALVEEAVEPVSETARPMTGQEFMLRFGGSFRMRNVVPVELNDPERHEGPWRRGMKPNARPFPLPPASELPAELIRVDPWEGMYLFLMASLARTGIVEIGRLHGGTAFLFACARGDIPIWSIDLKPRGDDELRGYLAKQGVGANVTLLVGDSQRDAFPEIGEFDVLFVDGDHSYEGVRGDLANLYPRLAPGGHVLFHDCNAGRPVQRAVLDFVDETDVEVIRSPYIPAAYWHTDYGSLAHLRKRR